MGAREEKRREKLNDVMRKEGIDGCLIVDPVNVSYLTGFNGEDSWLWLGDSGAVVLSDTRFEEQLKEECPDLDAAIRCSGQTTLGLLKDAASDSKYSSALPKRVAIEAESVTVALMDSIRKALPGVEFVPRANDVERLRSIKDELETELIRDAIRISIDAYRYLRKTIEEGATEADYRDELEYRMRKCGGDDVSFPSIIAYDARAALPHAIPQRGAALRDADMVLIDWGAKKSGYVGDLTRSFLTEKGKGNAEYRRKFDEIFRIVLEAHDKAIEGVRPGAVCCDVDRIARDHIRNSGYGDYFGHGLGHGIGRVVHDFGGFSPNNRAELVPGMIMTIEPGIYLPGFGGVRIEDDVLVTETGCEVLSKDLLTNE